MIQSMSEGTKSARVHGVPSVPFVTVLLVTHPQL